MSRGICKKADPENLNISGFAHKRCALLTIAPVYVRINHILGRRFGLVIKAVFIDIDNTLLSFEAYVRQTMEEGFAHFGLKKYEPYMFDVFTEENNRLWRMIEEGKLSFSQLESIRWGLVFRKLGMDFDGEVFERYFREKIYDSAIPEPGAVKLLEYLSGRYILCAASNGPYQQQVHRLDIAGMKKYFSYMFISEQVGASKPAKEFFDYAFSRLNEGRSVLIRPEETLIIGDSLTSDMAGGTMYGMKTCYYKRGRNSPVPEGIDFAVDELTQLTDLI